MKRVNKWLLVLLFLCGTAYAGLETVTHIQDLNASWPLGSDLASTSDDHIRNIKSALKTDFPNFNGTYTSAALPVFAIPSDTNTGMYSVAADDLGFSAGGTLRFDISTTAITSTIPNLQAAGSVGAPSISFSGDPDTGLYHPTANQLAATAGGTQVWISDATEFSPSLAVRGTSGTNAAPAYSFLGDSDTGIYNGSANTLNFTVGGTNRFDITTAAVETNLPFLAADGSAGAPGVSFLNDSDTGFYRDTSNQIGIALAGATAGQITQGSFTGTATGMSGTVNATVRYQRIGNIVILNSGALSGTSNATSFTMTGIPAGIAPSQHTGPIATAACSDNSAIVNDVSAFITASGTTLTFQKSGNSSGFTASGSKGFALGFTVTYML
jgi:hypothetical protein